MKVVHTEYECDLCHSTTENDDYFIEVDTGAKQYCICPECAKIVDEIIYHLH